MYLQKATSFARSLLLLSLLFTNAGSQAFPLLCTLVTFTPNLYPNL